MGSLSHQERLREIIVTVGPSTVFCTCVHLVVAPLWRKAIGRQRYIALKKREQLYLAEKYVYAFRIHVTQLILWHKGLYRL